MVLYFIFIFIKALNIKICNLSVNYYHNFILLIDKNYVVKLIKSLINYAHNNRLYYR